jgi:hypothetical protein
MKTMMALCLGLFLSIGIAAGASAAETTVTGHLRDSFCFLTMGAHGPSHHDCAMGCAKTGIPVLLVPDKTDQYYVLMPSKDKQLLPSTITDKMEDEVTVTGQEYSKGGLSFLTVESVK